MKLVLAGLEKVDILDNGGDTVGKMVNVQDGG
jgi:hypothetical protein